MKKRGQITIFIILGLILFLIGSLVIYFVTQREVRPLERRIQVATEVVPVYNLVSSCLYELGRKGLTTLGLQGGYLYLPPQITKNPFSYVAFDKFSFIKVPYWYYEGEDRSPSIKSMEKDVAKFIKENIKFCTKDFVSLNQQFSITEKEEPIPKVTFTDKEVVVELDWDLDVKTTDKTVRQEKYVAFLPVKIKSIFELASKTLEQENKYELFENLTMKLISSDPTIPSEGLEFECGTKRWHLNDIKNRLQSVLYYNIPRIRLIGTDVVPFEFKLKVYEDLKKERKEILDALDAGAESFTPPDLTPDDAFEYFSMTFDTNYPAKDLRAAFSYDPNWGMLINAQPNEGGVLKSNTIKGAKKYLKFLCINQWHFTYDVIYPVVMTIGDPSAFNDQGYVFQFAFPVIINDNEGERIYFGLKRFESVEFYSEFCDKKGDQEADVRVKGFVEDAPIAVDLADVNISIKCLFEECVLGKTRNIGGIYRWKERLPQGCANPMIIASKEGYLSTQKQLTSQFLDLTLTKLKPMKFSVVKHIYNSADKQLSDAMPLEKNERVSISLFLRNHSETILKDFPSNDTSINVPYASYSYDLNIVMHDAFGNVIGGFNVENLNISYSEVADKSEVVFHVAHYVPLPKTREERFDFTDVVYGNKLTNKLDKLKPSFK